MKYHKDIREEEIKTRSKNFNACLELGESLLQRQHQASEEVSGQWDGDRRQPSPNPFPTLARPDSLLRGLFRGGSLEPHQTHSMGWLLSRESRLITT